MLLFYCGTKTTSSVGKCGFIHKADAGLTSLLKNPCTVVFRLARAQSYAENNISDVPRATNQEKHGLSVHPVLHKRAIDTTNLLVVNLSHAGEQKGARGRRAEFVFHWLTHRLSVLLDWLCILVVQRPDRF